MKNEFLGKWILITGGSSGIGLAVVKKMHGFGANIISIQRGKNPKSLVDMKNVYPICFDLGEMNKLEGLLKKIYEISKKIDFIIFNASKLYMARYDLINKNEMQNCFDTNVFSSVVIMKELAKKLNKDSSVVFVSSGAPRLNTPGKAVYTMAEASIESYAKILAKEIAPKTRVNIIAPGPTKTPRLIKSTKEKHNIGIKELEEMMPLKRINSPNDVAESIIFLLSNKAKSITGQVLQVNCGGII